MKEIFMKRAIELALKGKGLTSPNPCVGAVIVKGDKIVAEGFHSGAGNDHAEVVAIKSMMSKSGIVTVDLDPNLFHNATLFVTLEPCSHVGKTGSCARTIVAAGFRKVCIGMKDPNKKVNGRGIKVLKDNGVEVELLRSGSFLSNEIRSINQSFIKFHEHGLPYLTLKAGISLDGKIATSMGDSKWITDSESRSDARLERSYSDAVLVGAGTVDADDPELAAHGKYKGKTLLRVIIDRNLRLSPSMKVFRDENVIVFCSGKPSTQKVEKFKKFGINVRYTGTSKNILLFILKYLAKQGVQSVFVEGGSHIHGIVYDSYQKNKLLLDRVLFYISPRLIGGEKALSVIGGKGVDKLCKASLIDNFEIIKLKQDFKAGGTMNFY